MNYFKTLSKRIIPSFEILQKHGTIHRSSQNIALDPIFMENSLRVGGGLKSTDLALNWHSQITIDKGHPLAPLIGKHLHKTILHCEHKLTLSSMRQQFWIPSWPISYILEVNSKRPIREKRKKIEVMLKKLNGMTFFLF